jgi:hypothetical protein
MSRAQEAKPNVIDEKAEAKISQIASAANAGDQSRSPIAGANSSNQEQDESRHPPAWAYLIADSVAAGGAIGALFAVGFQTRANRISSQRQLRAYIVPERGSIANVANVVPDPPELEQHARVVNPTIGPLANIVIKNAGQSPSYDVKHTATIYLRAYTNPPVTLARLPDESKPSVMILGPQVVASMDIWLKAALTPLEVDNLKAGLAVIYVVGIIEYTDIFGNPHATHYQMEHHSSHGKIGWNTKLIFSPQGNYGD